MATRNVNFGVRIGVGVDGEESLDALATRLDDVAKVLDEDLSQQAQKAAAKLRELGQQQEALSTFTKLGQEVKDTSVALKRADAEAEAYGKQIGAMGPPTLQEAANLQRLRAAADAVRSTVDGQTQAMASAKGELQRYGIAAGNVKDAQQRLRTEVAQVRESVQALAPAYQAAARSASTAGETMTRTHRQIGTGVDSISQQLGQLRTLYASLAGLQGAKALASDVGQTADEFKNLQSRIALVTGQGEAFTKAWAGITDVALRTNSELEATGTLFSRIAQAGKDAGLGAQEATNQALALTETINQATQLSGGSAASANAALTQLVQGFQSGVLRGDEFNSVMEQAPRLALALAAGLGVTTGELRKMAEAGSLTSDTVIRALRGQSEVLQKEFAQLPPTIGRALQNLSTQWTLYVGEADKATGASAAAAQAISLLGNNLTTIAGLLLDAGQAAAAFAAVRLAQHFLGIGAAATQTAAAVAASNAQLLAGAGAAATAATGASRFAAILGGLRTFGLLAIVTNFQDIGKWIGEATARLVGYRDRSQEIAALEAQALAGSKEAAQSRLRMAEATQSAVDKQFDLSKAARAAVDQFGALTKQGDLAGEALKKASDAFDLSKAGGIRDFAATLDRLVADGKLGALEFEAAWAKALSGKDLVQFEVTARAALAGTARESERLGQILDASLSEAVRRTGLSFEQLQGKAGAAMRSALNDVDVLVAGLDRLKSQGVDTGQALTASLGKAINTADSQSGIDAVRARVESLRKQLGDRLADGFLDQATHKLQELRDKADAATPGINSVREAMRQLGITSDATLKETAAQAKQAYDALVVSGKASARELGAGFKAAAEAAIEAGGNVVPIWVRAQAATRGFALETDAAGKTIVKSMAEAAAATARAGEAAGQAAGGYTLMGDASRLAAERAVEALERQIAAQERLIAVKEREAELERKRLGVDKEGFAADDKGNRVVAGGDLTSRTGIAAFLKSAGVDNEAIAKQIANEFANSKGEIDYLNNAGQIKYGGAGSTMSQAVLKAAEKYTFGDFSKGGAGQGTIPTPARDVNVNLTLDGASYGTVKTDDAGATALQDLLARLQNAKGTSR